MPSMKPQTGESKQEFLKRCASGEASAMPACAAAWNQHNMSAYESGVVQLRADVVLSDPEQAEQGPRRFSMLAYTGKLIDWGWTRFVIELTGMQLAHTKIPSLLQHRVDQIVGVIDENTTDATGFFVGGGFSQVTAEAARVLGLADEGFPWQASIGVRALRIEELSAGATSVVNGQTITGPADIWRETEIFEVSFVAFGADSDTAAVAMNHNPQKQEIIMPQKQQNAEQDSARLQTTGENAAPPQAPETGKQPEPAKLNAAPLVETISAAELAQLQENGKLLGLSPQDVTQALGNFQLSANDARTKLFELAAQKKTAFGAGSLDMGADESEKLRAAASDGFALAMGATPQPGKQLAPGHEDFRGMGLQSFARLCLERHGIRVSYMSKERVAQEVLKLSLTGVGSSDFASTMMDAAHRRLLDAYASVPATWEPWVNIEIASDFRTINGISLGDAPDLELVSENGEYKTGHLTDSAESYSVEKYGKIISLTYEMIVNDDLRAFARLPQMLGNAAARRIADFIYAKLMANPKMSNGSTVFHADHNNLANPVGRVSDATLRAGRTAMRKQKSPQGSNLSLRPKFLLVPAEQEFDAEILLHSLALPENGISAGVVNPHANKLIPISEPRLDDSNPDGWYLIADPAQVGTLEVSFLNGKREPWIEEDSHFASDAVRMKVRSVFGGGFMDYRGVYYNPGK